MRSSNGAYYEKLDHVRAAAAFLVFTWHFVHAGNSVPYQHVPAFPLLSMLEEGHTGVALFMTLSGYLFAKIVGDGRLDTAAFLRNRVVRLAPLLVSVFIVSYAIRIAEGSGPEELLGELLQGFVLPTWPNGGWSIAVELQLYLLLPFIIGPIRRNPGIALYIVAAAILVRHAVLWRTGSVQYPAYWTILGRIDQFVLGIYACYMADRRKVGTATAVLAACAFVMFFHAFNQRGGFYATTVYPSPDPVWVLMPTAEGAFYGLAIAFYQGSRWTLPKPVAAFLGFVGGISYSIYLMHFFVVRSMSEHYVGWVGGAPSYGWMSAASGVAFVCVLPIAWIPHRLVERPFMRFRTRYVRREPAPKAASGGSEETGPSWTAAKC